MFKKALDWFPTILHWCALLGLSTLAVNYAAIYAGWYLNLEPFEQLFWLLIITTALILFIVVILKFLNFIFDFFPRRSSGNHGADLIFQDDDELTFSEIAQRWSDSASPATGFSFEQVMTILIRAVWLGKIKEKMVFNYERAQTSPLYRPEVPLECNRASLAFVLAHSWSEALRFLVDPEKKCLSIAGLDGNGPVSKFHAEIERQYKELGTWKRLASLSYGQFRESGANVFQSAYIDPICIKKSSFLKWLKSSKVRLPENW